MLVFVSSLSEILQGLCWCPYQCLCPPFASSACPAPSSRGLCCSRCALDMFQWLRWALEPPAGVESWACPGCTCLALQQLQPYRLVCESGSHSSARDRTGFPPSPCSHLLARVFRASFLTSHIPVLTAGSFLPFTFFLSLLFCSSHMTNSFIFTITPYFLCKWIYQVLYWVDPTMDGK